MIQTKAGRALIKTHLGPSFRAKSHNFNQETILTMPAMSLVSSFLLHFSSIRELQFGLDYRLGGLVLGVLVLELDYCLGGLVVLWQLKQRHGGPPFFMHLHQCVAVQPVTLLQYTEVEEWHSGEGPGTLIMWMWTQGGRRGGGVHIQITYKTSSSSTLSLGRTPDVHEIKSTLF